MRILLIEDELKTLQSLQQGLEENGWVVDAVLDGKAAIELTEKHYYDVISSDIIIPGMDGLEFCRIIRQKGIKTPVLLLSALGETDDKIVGLEAGADDYLAKPFEFKEFLARIKALARRQTTAYKHENLLRFGGLEMDLNNKSVRRDGISISLTPKELALLEFFMRHPGQVLSKQEIAEKVWDLDFDTGTNLIEVYVNYLRSKIDKNFASKLIHTQFGQGYVLREE
jgi:two-component system copper resistance phosphate regulon response regulator CusR